MKFTAPKNCLECRDSEGQKNYSLAVNDCITVLHALAALDEMEDTVAKCSKGTLPISQLSKALVMATFKADRIANVFSRTEFLQSYQEVSLMRSAVAKDTLITFLRSKKGHKIVNDYFEGAAMNALWPERFLCLPPEHLDPPLLLAVFAFGKKISSDKFLVKAPLGVKDALMRRMECSTVHISDDVPLPVLETMAELWDPYSDGVLKDDAAALKTAKLMH